MSSLTGEGLQGLKQSIAEIISFNPNTCEEVEPMSTVDHPAMSLDDDNDEEEVLLSDHDIRVFKALEANMKEDEYDENIDRKSNR